jgi:protein phosphatase
MCSDGLSDMLADADIERLLLAGVEATPLEGTAKVLIDAANEAGGKDNISVILVRASGGATVSGRSWWPFKR